MVDGQAPTETLDGNQWSIKEPMKNQDDLDLVVEPGHAFVMGDNRNASCDSRNFGSVPLVDVVGKARQIWFSKSDDGWQWSRIGQRVH